MALTGNKGEWSEFYAFTKLLADGKIYSADIDLNKNENLFYLIIKILRGKLEYVENSNDRNVSIVNNQGDILSTISVIDLEKYSQQLYKAILLGKKGDRTFEIDSISEIMNTLKTNSLSDERKKTSDIRIVIHDPITQYEPLLGFSIKSYIGSKPTLFNASKVSNIIYQITPEMTDSDIEFVNKLESYSKRIEWLIEHQYSLTFKKLSKDIFNANLSIIDSLMPELLSHIVFCKYINKTSKLSDICQFLENTNPMKYDIKLNSGFYSYKIKRLLVDMALGMTAGKLWKGEFNADGGYIAVKNSGELVCFHIYNWNVFQEYLFNNTKLDSPDSNPNRCDYGRILCATDVDEISGTYIKLNFQVRFI